MLTSFLAGYCGSHLPSGSGTDVVRQSLGERIEFLSFWGAFPGAGEAAGEPVFEAPGALPPSGIAFASYRRNAACYLSR